MSNLYKIIDALITNKHMVRFNCWPGGEKVLAVWVYGDETDTYFYTASTLEELEKQVVAELSHLLGSQTVKLPPLKLPTPPKMPVP